MLKPRLEILPPSQRSLWDEMRGAIPGGFVLYGGTALALDGDLPTLTYGNVEDLSVTLRHFPRSALREVLSDPPPGVFDPRSWNYWHVVFGIEPTPELPKRRFADG